MDSMAEDGAEGIDRGFLIPFEGMTKTNPQRLGFLAALCALLLSSGLSTAHAFELAGEGAMSFNSNNYDFISTPSAMASGELTFSLLGILNVGFAYDHNFLSYKGGGSGGLDFYGAIGRLPLPMGLYADAQLGSSSRDTSGGSFSWGLGGGINFPFVPSVEVGPRISYRSVPDYGVGRSLIDIGLKVTISVL